MICNSSCFATSRALVTDIFWLVCHCPFLELCAVIIHRGRVITSGHYYVYIRKPITIETVVTEPDGETRTEQKTYNW